MLLYEETTSAVEQQQRQRFQHKFHVPCRTKQKAWADIDLCYWLHE